MTARCGGRGPCDTATCPRTGQQVLLWVALLVASASVMNAQAQMLPSTPLPPVIDPTGRSGIPPPLQKEEPVPPQRPPLVPPPAPPPPEKPRAPLLRVFVREIRIIGNTVFSAEELAAVTAPYLNRELTSEDFESLRQALTLYYVNHGYVTSGAVIPDQTVTEGIITIQIIEGKLSRIDIEGTTHFWPSYLRDRIALSAGPPVNIKVLQERLQLLQQDPRLARINAELQPGVVRGEAELHVKVAETSPYKAWVEFNNFQTPVVGAERGLGTVSHQNLTGHGDPFSFTYGRSEGVNPLIDTSYSIPFTPYDTTLSASYRRNDFLVVEAPFNTLNISSQSEIFGLSLLQPVYRTLNHQVNFSVTGERLFNKTILPGFPDFNLIPGSQNDAAIVSALRFIPEWLYRTPSTVFAVRSRFSVGLNVLGATINPGFVNGVQVPDGRFFAWLGQVQAVQRLDRLWGLQVLGRYDVQLASDSLFPVEQFPVGGRFSVRGYRENTLVRDNAMVATVEARLPVLRSAQTEDLLQIAAFLDYGNAWNNGNDPVTPSREFLASAGLGLRANFLPQNRGYFEVYWGNRLNHITNPRNDLQDYGIHLQLVVQVL